MEADYDCSGDRPIDEECCDPTNGLNLGQCAAIDCNDEANVAEPCCLPRVEPTIQERAWTSPIWYSPEAPVNAPVDPSGLAEECAAGGSGFQQEARYEMQCEFDTIAGLFGLEIAITVMGSVEPDGVLTQGIESAVTHSADISVPLLATLGNLAPDARTTLATVGLSISNASPVDAQNELEGTPTEVTADFLLNTVDTPATADGSGPVTLELVAFTISMNGLVTADGTELVPGGEATLTEESEECSAIALAPDSEAISFEVAAP